MNELISVIVPVYNVAPFLKRCVNSIIAQTYSNLEIILVDDGSTDGSGEMCDNFSELDSRIIVVHQKNSGTASAARNTGLNHLNGEYISFVDPDDYIDSNMLEELHKQIIENDAEMSVCSFRYVDLVEPSYPHPASPIKDEILTGSQLIRKMSSDENSQIFWSVVWNKLFKKRLFEGLCFPVGYAIEDLYIIYELFDRCAKVSCSSEAHYYYVQHQTSVLHSTKRWELDSPAVYLHLADFFSNRNEYIDLYKKYLEYGIYRYRKGFWTMRNEIKGDRTFKGRIRDTKRNFRSAWRKGRGAYVNEPKQFIYFELFYFSFLFARLVCIVLKK